MSSKCGSAIHSARLITLGDHLVGKTAILRRFCDDVFSFTSYTTVGLDIVRKTMEVDSEKISVKIWDTAGQERYHTITQSVYKNSDGILLVFDVTKKESLFSIHKWMSNIDEYADCKIVKYLIGNKIDSDDREVTKEEAEEMAKRYGMKYFETSARLGTNIDSTISCIVKEIREKSYEKHIEAKINVASKFISSGKASCC